MTLITLTILYNRHHYLSPRLFHHSKQNFCTHLCACFSSRIYWSLCDRVVPGKSCLVKRSPHLSFFHHRIAVSSFCVNSTVLFSSICTPISTKQILYQTTPKLAAYYYNAFTCSQFCESSIWAELSWAFLLLLSTRVIHATAVFCWLN